MLQYVCDWCHETKKHRERWILGFAAEKIGVRSDHRELTIAAAWSEKWAAHPLAVHFCSEAHKDDYLRALFGTTPKRRQRRARAATPSQGGVASAGSGRAVLKAQDGASAKTRRVAKRSGSNRRGGKNSDDFSVTDHVRAHGLGVRLDQASVASHAPAMAER